MRHLSMLSGTGILAAAALSGCFLTGDGECVLIDLTDPACSEVIEVEVVLRNGAIAGNIHILIPGEAFDPSNRLNPGQIRQVTVGVDPNGAQGVTFRAGLNGTVTNTVNCPKPATFTLKHVSWNGTNLVCDDWG